jgi:hypothetical protein
VRAVHETVADIAGQAAYRRSATDTLAARLWQLLVDTFDQILQTLIGTPTSRRITLAVLGVVVALLLLRLLLNERHARALARRRSPVARQQLGNAWDAAQRLAADGNSPRLRTPSARRCCRTRETRGAFIPARPRATTRDGDPHDARLFQAAATMHCTAKTR